MADWRIPDLAGVNAELNKVQEQLFEMFDNVKDGLEDTASTVIGNLEPDITTLLSNLTK